MNTILIGRMLSLPIICQRTPAKLLQLPQPMLSHVHKKILTLMEHNVLNAYSHNTLMLSLLNVQSAMKDRSLT